MLSQIQPHFIFNVLGTIRGLCRENPEQAWYGLGDFSSYLRANMNALTNEKFIPFESELAHVDAYIRLEQMRMGEKLNVVYDMLAKAGSKELTTKVSDYLMLSVYRMFRKLYRSEKKNSQSMFKVSAQVYESYTLGAMEKVSADINVLLTDKAVTKQIDTAFEMTTETMAKDYPKHTTGLLNTVKTAEELIK